MQYSVHPPNAFIDAHRDQLLPGWPYAVLAVVVVLQPCQLVMEDRTLATENYKQQLRQNFIGLGRQVADRLQQLGYQTVLFDPRTGLPLGLPPGSLQLDDVAVACAVLGYGKIHHGSCTMMMHPSWGSAVYPSTLVSSAPPPIVTGVMEAIAPNCSVLDPFVSPPLVNS